MGSGSSGPEGGVPELVLPALASAVRRLLAAAAWQPGQPRVGLWCGLGLGGGHGAAGSCEGGCVPLAARICALRFRLGQ